MDAHETDKTNLLEDNLDKWPQVLWIIFSIVAFISGFFYLQSIVLVVSGALGYIFIKERWRRRKEGYYVDWQIASSEDGYVTYSEEGVRLHLYFYMYSKDDYDPVVYVPSDERWIEIMPEWAKYRKDEIVSRVKKHIRKWKYEETDEHYSIALTPPIS